MNDYIMMRLLELKDDAYADFQAKLTPTIERDKFIGVRIPLARKLAKEIKGTTDAKEFLNRLPHDTYDENILHGMLLSEIKDYDECITMLDSFLPYVDNWAVCDTMSPKVLGKRKEETLRHIKRWTTSSETYKIRFGIETLMRFYLDDDFKEEYLLIPSSVKSSEYYVNMMISWFYAAALAKRWDETIKYIEEKRLDPWVHNKTIQKAIESYRITDEKKQYLRSLKI